MAQFDAKNSLVRQIIVEYTADAKGIWQKKTGGMLDDIDGIESTYAFEKKSGTVYAKTKNGNYRIVLNKEFAKVYKTSQLAPIVESKLIQGEVDKVTKQLEDYYEGLNQTRRAFLQDSTDRARRDSIEKARQDSIQNALAQAAAKKYREAHNCHDIPMSRIGIECMICGMQVYENSIYAEGVANDTLYFVETVPGIMDCSYKKLHAGLVSPRLQRNEKFTYHMKIYKDSLYNKPYLTLGFVEAYNKESYEKYAAEVAVKAPNGYIDSWGYDFQEGQLVFDFTYTNTSTKEIRAIDIFYNIRDAAGNVKKSGKLRADGPVTVFEQRQWNWTDSKIPVPDSSVDMDLTRLIITFKDGKQKNIAKKDMLIRAME
jgi:hypothetical protein